MTICGCSSHSDGSNLPETEENAEPTDSAAENAAITEKPSQETYEYINPNGKTLEKRINVPQRYIRTEEKSDSLANFLRAYKLKKDGSPVLLYDGSEKGNQTAHVAVFKLPIENEDLQQCAD